MKIRSVTKGNQTLVNMVVAAMIVAVNFLLGCERGAKLLLSQGGNSRYQIVVPYESDSIVNYAASELAGYLEKISGASFKVVQQGEIDSTLQKIFVGVPIADPTESLPDQSAIKIVNSGSDIFICGGSSLSTLYGVYHFLEESAGVKWLAPGVEVVPGEEKIKIAIPLNYSYSPAITTRTVHSRLFYDHPDFAARLKVTAEAFPGYVPTARVHTFQRFMPEGIFFDAHPEYYALREGRRIPTQLCLTNPDVARIVSDSVGKYFERFPDAGVISVSQNDNTLYCECDKCSMIDREEGSPAGTMIRFVNGIAAAYPGKTISTLAYQYTRKPPVTKPAPNVLITLCSIECDRSAPIVEKCTAFASDLAGWKEKTGNIRIWDYTTQFTNFLAPFPNFHTLAPNIRFFRDNNARWVFEQHSHNPSELFELRSYLMARLLWNPDLDPNEIIYEFTEGYYGRAGKYIRGYIEDITREIKAESDFFLFLYGDPSQGFGSFLSPDRLDFYSRLYDLAEESVAGESGYPGRVKSARLSIDYAVLEACRASLSKRYSLSGGEIDVAGLLDSFSAVCSDAGVTLMNEMGYTVDEYVGGYRRAIARSEINNVAEGKNVTLLTEPKKYAGENPMTLTDGALGGSSFFSNWLGFEGNDMVAVIDLGEEKEIDSISTAFLQVTNHIVFFPESVKFSYSADNSEFSEIATIATGRPLKPGSKVNDIEYFEIGFDQVKARYIKVEAVNMKRAPGWHNASGLPAWIFCDEIIIN